MPEKYSFIGEGVEVADLEDEEEAAEADPEQGIDEEEEKEEVKAEDQEAAVSAEDRVKIRRMHVNLGHPNLESFVRFLKAGRVRKEVNPLGSKRV